MKYITKSLCICLLVAISVACANNVKNAGLEETENYSSEQSVGIHPNDKWERFNRGVFAFNDWFDRNLLVPVAKGYTYITPDGVERSISNVFSNLAEPVNLVNNSLQGDFVGAGTSFFRFVVNTVFGAFGIFDVATELGMQSDKEDFGQTLGSWGVGEGYYLVLPFLGPTTTRDVFSNADRLYYDKYWPIDEYGGTTQTVAFALDILQLRAGLLEAEQAIIGDRYTFIRDVYLQRREYVVNDGKVIQDDFTFEDDEDFDNLDEEF